MKTFTINGEVTVSCFITIAAKSAAEAIRKARDLPVVYQVDGSGYEAGEAWGCSPEPDGVPANIRVD